jgi:Fe-S cluster biosynthesis and repair protein YggX
MVENAEPASWMKHQRLCINKPPSNMFDHYSKTKVSASQQDWAG